MAKAQTHGEAKPKARSQAKGQKPIAKSSVSGNN